MEQFVIETQGLTKEFNKFAAVKNLNLKVPRDLLYGFLGPNGAGKSTTIRMLLGLIKPTQGTIYLFNQDLGQHRMEILRKVGFNSRKSFLLRTFDCKRKPGNHQKILKLPPKEIDKALDIVKLSRWKTEKVKNFSLGMKQRLGIAQALIGNRELLILDEPTNGLDPAGVREIRELIISLPEIINATVLISSHIF